MRGWEKQLPSGGGGGKGDTLSQAATASYCGTRQRPQEVSAVRTGGILSLFPDETLKGVMADLEMNPALQFPAQGTVMTTLPFLLHNPTHGQSLT